MHPVPFLEAVVELLVVLGIMVIVHEFGHFAAAKLCGVRVEAFAVGFGKKLFGVVRGGTEYRINAIPLGGYVKMSGELPGEEASDDPAEFQNHPRWQRMIIALAGPIANFILAFGLMTGVYMLHNEVEEYLSGPAVTDYVPANTVVSRTGLASGDTIVHLDTLENPTWEQAGIQLVLNLNQTIPFSYLHNGKRVDTKLFVESKEGPDKFSPEKLGLVPMRQTSPVQVQAISEASMPAAQAGLKPGDKIASIDGLQLHSVDALLTYLQDRAGKPASLIIQRNDTQIPVAITPALGDIGNGTKLYRLGFTPVPPPIKIERLSLPKAITASVDYNEKTVGLIGEVLKRLFTRQVSVKSLSSPIGIGVEVHQAIQQKGWLPIVGLMAYISLNLGIFNLLPFPILDGGMIVFLIIESIMRRDMNQQVKERIYQAAFVCLILFAAMVIFNDVSRLIPAHTKP